MKEKLTLAIGLAIVVVIAVAAWYWSSYGGRAARLAKSDDPRERLQAVRELRGKDTSLALRTLEELSEDPDTRVAVQAVQALGAADSDRAGEMLRQVLDSSDRGAVRGEAAAALGQCKGTSADVLGEKLRSDPDAEARTGAAKGLARLRDVRGLKYLVHALEFDRDAGVRRVAIIAIQKILVVRFAYDPRASQSARALQVSRIKEALKKLKLL